MKIRSLRPTVPILAGAISLLLGALAPTATAANKKWTELTGHPVWATLALGNWTGILAPTRIVAPLTSITTASSPGSSDFGCD
ncbi:MAG: hypothetical protein P4L99_15345 [Chthoniobacter sp.]|nr:hypothetical protein [Chthoniobacter sp.]